MDQDNVYNQEELDDITPYENYVSAIRDSETKNIKSRQVKDYLVREELLTDLEYRLLKKITE